MAKRGRERERAREERMRLEQEQAAQERRRRVLQLGAIAVFVAIVVVAILIVISQSGGSDSGGNASSIEGAATVSGELRGLAQSGNVLGDPSAPVTITEYGDLQCPVCAAFATEVTPQLIDSLIAPGDARLEFKTFNIIGPESEDAAKAAYAAAEQDRMWDYVGIFYANQGAENSGYVTDEFMRAIAVAAGVPDLAQWESDRGGDAVAGKVADVLTEAQDLGLNATPSFVVKGPGGSKTLVAPSLSQIEQAVREVG